jgi:N-acetylglucosamine-6-phosphate deacetylase
MNQFIGCERLFDGEQWLEDHVLLIEDDRIKTVIPINDLPLDLQTTATMPGIVAPGFIDLQVNGGGGVMLNNAPTPHTVDTMTLGHRATGTTGMMPTVISDTPALQKQAIDAVRAARDNGNPGVLGIHIEGPFFESSRRGTHKADMIRPPTQADIDWLCSIHDLTLMLTLAPEHASDEQIETLARAGILTCAGHTNASYEDITRAAQHGLRGFTHLFNAMSPLQGRSPGAVGAALDNNALWAGIIADGHHVHAASIRIACHAKPQGKVFLVTDAMATVGATSDSFELYGEQISVKEGRLVNAEGALAGSAIGMIDAVRFCHEQVGLALTECLRMASLYPAQFLDRDGELGRIAPGYRADMVHFDSKFQVQDTWVAGHHQSHAQ